MNEFEKMIAETVANKLNDGTVEKLIEQKIEEAIKKGLDEVFGYCGDEKKLIEKKLNETIVPVIESHDFNQYLVKLDEVLTSIVNQTNIADNKRILESFKECLTEPQQKEIKLSEIFEKYCQYVADYVSTDDLEACCEDGEPYYECVTANMEVEYEDTAMILLVVAISTICAILLYDNGGTVEEFKALKEKNVAKKPYLNRKGLLDVKMWHCPVCKKEVASDWNRDLANDYCHNCGQKLDWQ